MFIIDSNQKSHSLRLDDDLVPLLEGHTAVIPQALDAGDIMFAGVGEDKKLSLEIGIELKKVPSDLMASMRDGRLLSQLPRMLELYDLSYLLFIDEPIRVNSETGMIRERKKKRVVDSGWRYHHVNSILMKFEAAGGKIRSVPDMEHAALFLLSLHSYWHKPWDEHDKPRYDRKRHKLVDWKKIKDKPLAEVYERIGHGNRRLGIKRAMKLADLYPDFMSLSQATVPELAAIPGFGRKSAKVVMEFVNKNGAE